MKLLIDIGNSRIKWALANDSDSLIETGALEHGGDVASVLEKLTLPCTPESIWVASVAGAPARARLPDVCNRRWKIPPEFVETQVEQNGLKNAYAEPMRLGVDRWLAMLAAWDSEKSGCLIADAGTALTIDAFDAEGQHLGGIIAAGLRTSEKAVLGATRFSTRDADHQALNTGLATHTEACVRQGALLSCLGAIEHVAEQYPDANAILTGGDAMRLCPFLSERWQLRPNLVLEGILVAARSG